MSITAVDKEEMAKRRSRVVCARKMIAELFCLETLDEDTFMTEYQDFFVQISFSEIHPLIVIYFVRKIPKINLRMLSLINEQNLTSVLGCHSINDWADCYSYRATLWLDVDFSRKRFEEILIRCVEEAQRGYRAIM